MSSQGPRQSQPDELIGRVINDRFRVVNVLARGGMGRVYRAEQVPLGRLVALKTLDPRFSNGENDPQFQQRFFLEASIASKLQHPNTVTVFDYGRTPDGIYFIAMELVEGRSLLSAIRTEAPFVPERVVHIGLQIARSLREAHRLDVIHRDLKPGNVLLMRHGDEDDFVKVLDFGLVKHLDPEHQEELTKAGLFIGSPKYMSPEQIRGDRVDRRSDIYALGVVMYEMLTGRTPFDRDTTVKVLMAHIHEDVPAIDREDCPPALSGLVMRCLSKAPEGRPASMDEVILLIKQASGAPHPLSQEIRVPSSPGISSLTPGARLATGTPSQPFVSGTHALVSATPQAPLSSAQILGPSQPPKPASQHPEAGAPVNAAAAARTLAMQAWLPRVAVLAAILISGGFLALRFIERGGKEPSSTVVASPSPAPASIPAPQVSERAASAYPKQVVTLPAAPPPAQNHVVVHLTSSPPGASVVINGRSYGETPVDVELWGKLAETGKEVSVAFQKEGFYNVTLTRVIEGGELSIEATLPRGLVDLDAPPAPAPSAPKPPRASEQPTSTEQSPAPEQPKGAAEAPVAPEGH